MKSRLKKFFLLIFISQLCFSACTFSEKSDTNIVNDETENGKELILNKDDIITAYINAMNKMTWEYVDGNNTYDKIVKQESLQGPANCKIYFSKEKGNVSKKNIYYIDFIYQLKNHDESIYSSLRISYSPEFSCFSSEFVDGGPASGSYEVVQKELSDIGAIFIDETVINFPKPFVPDTKMTEKKEKMVKEIKIKIKELSKNIYGKGIYKVYIWDFSDADSRTRVLITNKDEKIMAEYPIEFYDEKGNEDIHVSLGVHVDTETSMDYSVGSMKYYKFFQMFTINKFIVNVDE